MLSKMSTHNILSLLAGMMLALPFVGIAGCGPTHTGLCERAAKCGGGREPEIDACVVSMDAREEQAELFSCEKEFDNHVDCLDESGTCIDERLAGCEGTREALDECVGRRRSGHAQIELKSAD